MAIERVPYPSSPPASDSDWTLLLSLISTMALNANGQPIKVVSGNIVKGSWFQIGGTFYLATSDTAITGSASDYVKITPSGATAAAAYVADLSGVTWSDTYNWYYDGSGNLYIFDEALAKIDGEISTEKDSFVTKDSDGNANVSAIVKMGGTYSDTVEVTTDANGEYVVLPRGFIQVHLQNGASPAHLLQGYINDAWKIIYQSATQAEGGFVYSDGTNYRIYHAGASSEITSWYRILE